MKLYIAGPMTGIPEYNFPAFNKAATVLRDKGFDVVNPAELDEQDVKDGKATQPWSYYLRRDLKALLECDGIFALKGHDQSRGATLEISVAKALEMPVFLESPDV